MPGRRAHRPGVLALLLDERRVGLEQERVPGAQRDVADLPPDPLAVAGHGDEVDRCQIERATLVQAGEGQEVEVLPLRRDDALLRDDPLDGAEAIARFGAEPFDLVFTDLAMPRVSGWQVARAVKEIAPAVPVFLVTGFGVELSAEERRTHGVDAVLVKPLKIQQILDVVAQVARGRVQPTRTEDER